jgi:putative chitinase
MPKLDRASIAEECVRQGVYFGIEPHYLLGVAQLRSGISSDDDGDRKGLFRLTQAQWNANSKSDEFDISFTPKQISSPIRQCVVFALMAHSAFDDFVKANNRNPTAKELYLQQLPGADATGLQAALDNTAPLIGPAANAVLDDPQSVSTVGNADQPTSGPPVITPDPIPPVPGAGGGMLTLAMLQRHWPVPPAKADIIQGMANTSGVLSQLGINTPLRMAHFMAQISEETGNGREITESLSYSAERMIEVFPRRFPTLASTQGFVHDERAFGDKVYNGRMGNRLGSDDGFNFRGRGCLQLTGRDSYDALGKSLGLDLVNNPDLVNAPQNVLLIAGTEFVKLGCLPECDRNNVAQVSARINLGHPTSSPEKINGLDERRRQLGIWKQEFGL